MEKDAAGIFSYGKYFKQDLPLYTDISDKMSVAWKHNENDFLDYNVQYLIPHAQSTRGPKIAVADVNKDGLDDFYVCGAPAQPGALIVQTKEGKFTINQHLL